ncbi:hypothetical protein ACHAW5_007583 [Stephanodiscus triporus]|uniref:UBC core domain-containing protein n=1 Tax=Stephanodiscus triporus TaxID=2934178 RepID=A0ABD3Q9P6_9STRA
MEFFPSFGGGGKRKTPPTESGTGYGGQPGDTKKLIAGRKKAEKASTKDDRANVRFLQQMQSQLQNADHRLRSKRSEFDDEVRKKLSTLLADTFRNQVPTDWDQRKDLYKVALDVCRTLATNASLGTIFGHKDESEGVLYWLLDFSQHAKDILNRQSELGWTAEDENDLLLATHVIEVAEAALKISRRCPSKPVAELSVVSLGERYQSKLGPLRFDSVDTMQNHFFLQKMPTAPSLDTRLLFKELVSYRTALPVEYGSSCFCRVINSRLDMVRVMITGPDESPYANGIFLFDVNLPSTYPRVSPKVQFLTTGGGSIRFNPNLYNDGKVCLSLLGTWSGPGWVSGQSTLLQVLISIQSLILVPDPYYNEPAWESSRGTAHGAAQSKAYNQKIRTHTLSTAIESHLSSILSYKNPYVEFESVMINHFLEKRSLIQHEIWSWVKDDSKLKSIVDKICSLLEQLSNRERGLARSRRIRGTSAVAKKATETINLYDSEEDETFKPQTKKPHNGPVKSNETIEIDLSDDEEEKKDEKEGSRTVCAKSNSLMSN